MLSQLAGRRSLADMVEVLRPAAGRLRDGPDNAATLEWREPMAEMTVLEAQTREWQRELLKQGFERGIEQGQRTLLCRLAARRFGADAGEDLGEILARDPSRLEASPETRWRVTMLMCAWTAVSATSAQKQPVGVLEHVPSHSTRPPA